MHRIRTYVGAAVIAAGLAVLGTAGWQYGVDNWLSEQNATSEASHLASGWSASIGTQGEVVYRTEPVPLYQPFARIFIPRLGSDWVRVVAEGTSVKDVLDRGRLGHYSGTAMPGQMGTFAVAGHRMTHGASFTNLDTLQNGDLIYVQTSDGWYTYEFQYERVVSPKRGDAVAPVPFKAGSLPTERLMVMTTCTPKWTAEKRLVAVAKMVAFNPGKNAVPSAIAKLVSSLDQ